MRRDLSTAAAWLALVSCALLAACGGGEGDERPSTDESVRSAGADDGGDPDDTDQRSSGSRRGGRSSTEPAESLGSEPYPSGEAAGLGALHGEIRYSGEPPERFPLGARQKPECTTHPDVDHLSDIEIVNDGKVQYVYVYVKSGYDEAAVPPAPDEPVVLGQIGCMYTPHVVALQLGQALHVTNDDPTNHNVNYRPKRNDSGNRNMGRGQQPMVIDFERAETSIRFKCDIHPWMSAWVHVCEHPWFAVTDAAGSFRIPDVPSGEYVVEAVHESFGKARGRVVVEAGKSTGFALTLD